MKFLWDFVVNFMFYMKVVRISCVNAIQALFQCMYCPGAISGYKSLL